MPAKVRCDPEVPCMEKAVRIGVREKYNQP